MEYGDRKIETDILFQDCSQKAVTQFPSIYPHQSRSRLINQIDGRTLTSPQYLFCATSPYLVRLTSSLYDKCVL